MRGCREDHVLLEAIMHPVIIALTPTQSIPVQFITADCPNSSEIKPCQRNHWDIAIMVKVRQTYPCTSRISSLASSHYYHSANTAPPTSPNPMLHCSESKLTDN
jgi:hypothetical protein